MAMPEEKLPTLHEYLDEQEEVKSGQFTVDTEEKANWALRKLRKIEEQRAEDIALAEAEIEKINAWADQVHEKSDREMQFFQGLLMQYAQKRRKVDPKFKSLKLPNGKIRFKKQQDKWEYDDEKLVASLKKAGKKELIRIKEEPKKTDIKKHYKAQGAKVIDPDTGEVLEGAMVEFRIDKFEWEVE
jgi:hypothetical protein